MVNDRDKRAGQEWLFFIHVVEKNVGDIGDKKDVEDIVVVFNVHIKDLIIEALIGKGGDGGEEAIGPSIKGFTQK
jgi:hypothetical protein